MAHRSDVSTELPGMTIKSLRKIASELDIPGRSKMTRKELLHQVTSNIGRNGNHAHTGTNRTEKPESVIDAQGPSATSSEIDRIVPESSPEGPFSARTEVIVEPTAPPYLDRGRPIPDTYGDDHMGFMIQGPRSGYVYWELSGPLTERFRMAYGKDLFGSTRWALKIHAVPYRQSRFMRIDVQKYHAYIELDPDCRFQIALGFHDTDGSFVHVLQSGAKDTPRDSVSPVVDERRMIDAGLLLSMVGGIRSIRELGSSSLQGVRFRQSYEMHGRDGDVR